jgi:hypothetical protein
MALCLGQVFSKDKTFRPRKRFEPGTQRFELYKKAQASLKSGLDLRKVVQLPEGENINDWIAVHVVDFFNRINLIYGTVSEFCSERSCPTMSGGLRYEYRWQDGEDYRKPTKLPALRYMNLLMDWIESRINDEDIFPTRVGVFEEQEAGMSSPCIGDGVPLMLIWSFVLLNLFSSMEVIIGKVGLTVK